MKLSWALLSVTALLSGLVATLEFAPLSWWWMLGLSWLILWQLWYERPSRAPVYGLLWGLGHYGSGVYWLFNSLYYFGHAHWLTAVLMTGGFVFYLALFPALAGGFYWWFTTCKWYQDHRLVQWTGLVAVWCLIEYWRTNVVFGGFPWLASGYSQLHGFADQWFTVVGTTGAGWFYMLFVACLHLGVRRLFTGRGSNIRTGAGVAGKASLMKAWASRLEMKWLGGGVVLAGMLGVSGLLLPDWSQPINRPLSVAVVHSDMPQQDKLKVAPSVASVEQMLRLSKQAQAQLLVWPETSIPFYARGYARRFLDQIDAFSLNQLSLIGIFYRDQLGKTYNSIYRSTGGESDYYHKQRLVPFGEYMPARWLFAFLEYWIDIPQSDLIAGRPEPPPLERQGVKVHANVCYELFFADLVHQQALDSHLLVNVSNDAWFGRAVAPAQSLEMARARSAETERAVLRSSNQGISAIIDEPSDLLISVSGDYQLLTGEIQPRSGATPIVLLGQVSAIGWAILLFVLSLTWCIWRKNRPTSDRRD